MCVAGLKVNLGPVVGLAEAGLDLEAGGRVPAHRLHHPATGAAGHRASAEKFDFVLELLSLTKTKSCHKTYRCGQLSDCEGRKCLRTYVQRCLFKRSMQTKKSHKTKQSRCSS